MHSKCNDFQSNFFRTCSIQCVINIIRFKIVGKSYNLRLVLYLVRACEAKKLKALSYFHRVSFVRLLAEQYTNWNLKQRIRAKRKTIRQTRMDRSWNCTRNNYVKKKKEANERENEDNLCRLWLLCIIYIFLLFMFYCWMCGEAFGFWANIHFCRGLILQIAKTWANRQQSEASQ